MPIRTLSLLVKINRLHAALDNAVEKPIGYRLGMN